MVIGTHVLSRGGVSFGGFVAPTFLQFTLFVVCVCINNVYEGCIEYSSPHHLGRCDVSRRVVVTERGVFSSSRSSVRTCSSSREVVSLPRGGRFDFQRVPLCVCFVLRLRRAIIELGHQGTFVVCE